MNLERKIKKHSCYLGSCCQPLAATRCLRLFFHPLHLCIFDRWVAWLPFRKKTTTNSFGCQAHRLCDTACCHRWLLNISIIPACWNLKLPMMLFIRHFTQALCLFQNLCQLWSFCFCINYLQQKCRLELCVYLFIYLLHNLFNFVIIILL